MPTLRGQIPSTHLGGIHVNKTLIAVFAGMEASAAQAQLIFGNDQTGTTSLYYIDVGTGVATPILTTATNETKPWGMAYDPATNTLYWNNGGNLYKSAFSMTLTPTLSGKLCVV